MAISTEASAPKSGILYGSSAVNGAWESMRAKMRHRRLESTRRPAINSWRRMAVIPCSILV
jgi:hypothetical protein